MATPDDVKKLAALARVSVSEEELPKFVKEFEAILAYVGQLEELGLEKDAASVPAVHNVFRADGEPHESGKYTEKLVEQFSAKEDNALSVKQIISHN